RQEVLEELAVRRRDMNLTFLAFKKDVDRSFGESQDVTQSWDTNLDRQSRQIFSGNSDAPCAQVNGKLLAGPGEHLRGEPVPLLGSVSSCSSGGSNQGEADGRQYSGNPEHDNECKTSLFQRNH